jgi:hypothetical protein
VTADAERGADHGAVLIDDILLGLVALEVGRGGVSFNRLKLSRGCRSSDAGGA